MSSYKTYYSGTTDRITNLQLGVRALDGTLVSPGGTFSLNDAIGERTIERGYAIVSNAKGKVLTSPGQIKPRDVLHVRLAEGSAEVSVAGVQDVL